MAVVELSPYYGTQLLCHCWKVGVPITTSQCILCGSQANFKYSCTFANEQLENWGADDLSVVAGQHHKPLSSCRIRTGPHDA